MNNTSTTSPLKVDINDTSSVSFRDIYAQLCHGRELELSLLWQRSVVLTAFMLGCFTAYWAVVSKWIERGCHNVPPILNFAAFAICLVGIAMSCLWVMMSKGSKSVCQLYEGAMKSLGESVAHESVVGVVSWVEKSLRENVPKASQGESNSCFLSTKGWMYSVTRLNIAIGHLGLTIWIVLAIVHIVLADMSRHGSWISGAVYASAKWCSQSAWFLIVLLIAVVACVFCLGVRVYNSKDVR